MTALVVVLLACALVGHLLDRALLGDPATTVIERSGRALMLGLGGLGTTSMLLDVACSGMRRAMDDPAPSLRLGPSTLGAAAGVLAALLALVAWRRRGRRETPAAPEPLTWREHGVHLLLLLFGVGGLLLAVRSGWIRPTFQFDALLRWMFKAKALFHDGTLDGPVSLDPFFALTHQRYPPLVSHVAALPAFVQGAFDDRIGSAVFPWYAVALAGVVYGALARRVGRLSGALAVAWIGHLPLVSYLLTAPPGAGAASAMADIPLALFVTGAALAAADAAEGRRRGALLEAGLLAGFAALTKNEGLPFVAALGAGLLVASTERRWRRAVIVVAWGLGLFAAAWWSLAQRFPALDEDYLGQLADASALEAGVARLGLILPQMATDMVDFRQWNASWVAAAALLVAGGRQGLRIRAVRLLLVVSALQLLAYVYAFMITRWTSPAGEIVSGGQDTLPFLMTLTMGRLLMHVAPLTVCAGLLAAPLSLRRPPAAPASVG